MQGRLEEEKGALKDSGAQVSREVVTARAGGGPYRCRVRREPLARKGSLCKGAGGPWGQDRELRVHSQAAGGFPSHIPGWHSESRTQKNRQ